MSENEKKRRRHPLLRFMIFFWLFVLGGIGLTALLFWGISVGMLGKLPDIAELENPKTNLASEIYSEDSVLLGKFYYENRSNVDFKDLSPNLVNALIATEDSRFYKHAGIDIRGLGRVFFKTFVLRRDAGGGSTITQQLAKNLFTDTRASSMWERGKQKLKEWVISLQLERRYTKEEIITMYFNTVQFSGNSYGIKSASKVFFNTTPDKLKVEEAAMLVGVLKAISKFNPKSNPENAMNRRNTVLAQMEKYNYLTKSELDSIRKKPIVLDYQDDDHNQGTATYFREYLRQYLSASRPVESNYLDKLAYEIDLQQWDENPLYGWINKNTKPDGSKYDLYKDGLKIYVTINSKMQRYAEQATHKHLQAMQKKFYEHWKNSTPWGNDKEFIETAIKRTERYRIMKVGGASESEIKKAFNTKVKMKVFTFVGEKDTVMTPTDSVKYYKYIAQAGFMSVDPRSGAIKAWVGGIDHKYFKYDHVNIHATRQVGSTFKPFVYTKYVEEKKNICTTVPDRPVTFILEDGNTWTPSNSDGKERGDIPMWKALALSINNATAFVMKELGPKAPLTVIELARKMGVKNYLDPYPSICLGVSSISLFEMVGAYSTFANKGFFQEPYFIAKITDKNDGVLQANYTANANEAMNEKTAFLMLKMLERVTAGGTATRLRSLYGLDYSFPIAGKTGTTQNNSDGWFIGITPTLVSGAWVGWDDMKIRFRSTDLGQGAAMALPIFAYYMKDIYADKSLNFSKSPFEAPKDTEGMVYNCPKSAEDDKDEDGSPTQKDPKDWMNQ